MLWSNHTISNCLYTMSSYDLLSFTLRWDGCECMSVQGFRVYKFVKSSLSFLNRFTLFPKNHIQYYYRTFCAVSFLNLKFIKKLNVYKQNFEIFYCKYASDHHPPTPNTTHPIGNLTPLKMFILMFNCLLLLLLLLFTIKTMQLNLKWVATRLNNTSNSIC